MKNINISVFMPDTLWVGWHRWVIWSLCISTIILLGLLRTESEADFTFGSLAVLPVFVIAWMDGKKSGLFIAFFAVAMWVVADTISVRQFGAQWIPWANAASRLMTYSLVVLLTDQIRLQYKKENMHATRDSLTGVLNRRIFFELGVAEVERSKRDAHSVSVIFLDLDDFKQLNDTKGHDAGDAALRATAKAMLGALPGNHRVARLGGDEFAVILPEVEYEAAVAAGQKICIDVNAALKNFSPVMASIGVAWFETADRLFPAMVKAADELMYEVKENGKHNMRAQRYPATGKHMPEGGDAK